MDQKQATEVGYFENVQSESQSEFIAEQTNCPLCGAGLEMSYDICVESAEIEERPNCPDCHVRIRPSVHSVH